MRNAQRIQQAYKPNKLVRPFVKWVGGKRQLMGDIKQLLPKKKYATYYEPFVGGGAVLWNQQPSDAVISDYNFELINLYCVIKTDPDALINALEKHKNDEDYFYEIRQQDRTPDYAKLSNIKRAARIIFLNKTCFNGLYRVNNSGEFNAPYGRYVNPNIVDKITIMAVSNYLNKNNVKILEGDFQAAVTEAKAGDFVYFDPPYDPVSNSASFTGYTKGGFDRGEQQRLKDVCDHLNSKRVKFMLSNSATEFIQELYDENDYNITFIRAKRAINSNGNDRGEVAEVLIRNYV